MKYVVVGALLFVLATAVCAGSAAGQSIILRDLAGHKVYLDSLLAKGVSKRFKSAAQAVKQIRLCQEQMN